VWYLKDPSNISEESLVEHTLSGGTWDDFKELVRILSVERVAKSFRQKTGQPRTNYRPEVKNLFELYFDRHVT
jgi:hypothetical protein